MTPFGVGSSLEGHVIPIEGGISLDLSRMDRIVAVEPENLSRPSGRGHPAPRSSAPPDEHGLWFPVDPGADATLGGMAATNASGTTTVRFGKMRPNVLGARGGAPRRERDPHGLARAQDVGRLRPDRAARRLRRDARRDHGADAAPLRDPGARRCRSCLVPDARGRVPDSGRLGGRRSGRATRSSSSTRSTCRRSTSTRAPTIRRCRACSWRLPGREGRSTATSSSSSSSQRRKARSRLSTSATRTARAALGCATQRRVFMVAALAGLPALLHRRLRAACGASGGGDLRPRDRRPARAPRRDPRPRRRRQLPRRRHARSGRPAEVAGWHELSRLVVEDAIARGGTCTGEHGIGLGKLGALELEHPDCSRTTAASSSCSTPTGS